MSIQRIIRRGHDFPKGKRVGMLTLNLFGENPCVVGRTHQNCQLPSFLSFLPKPSILPEGGWGSYCLEGKGMENFEWGRARSSGVLCFACRGKKTPESYVYLTPAFAPIFRLSRFLEKRDVLSHHHYFYSIIDSSLTLPSHRVEAENNKAFLLCMYPSRSASMFP